MVVVEAGLVAEIEVVGLTFGIDTVVVVVGASRMVAAVVVPEEFAWK